MNDKIRIYLEHAFADAPQNQKTIELKEELYSNLLEKYNDQLRLGRTEPEAYNIVISGIGDISELINSVQPGPYPQPTPRERSKRALITALAVMLYILSPFMVILFDSFGNDTIGILSMFALIAAATGLLIYNHMTRPTYIKTEDTMVEEFKEWRVNSGSPKKSSAYRSFRSAFWILIVALYLLLSFLFHIWSFSWIIFIIAAAIEGIIKGILQLREGQR